MFEEPTSGGARRALHRFAMLAVGATFCLIFVGGLVTSTGSALAVPDWPLAFGKLIPAWQGGIRFEFAHRVVAGLVIIITLGLMIWVLLVERRRWVRNTALAAFGLILVQAVLGGITVLFELPLAIAVMHAATAQAFFCVMVAIAIFTNPHWEQTAPGDESAAGPPLATLAAITTGAIYAQILVGALMRHLGAGLAIPDFPLAFGQLLPPYWNEYIVVNFVHRIGALVVSALIIWTVARVLRSRREFAELRRPALALIVLLILQVSLGAFTVWSQRAVLPTTSHVAIGAAVLATSLTLTIRAYHLFGWVRGGEVSRASNMPIVAQRVSA
jgi:heme a synthase